VAVDDMVIEWREFVLDDDATSCTPGRPELLRPDRNGTAIVISYEPACSSADNDIEYGPLAAVDTYGYSGSVCMIGNDGSHTFDPGGGSFFYILVATDGSLIEGSYGEDSSGSERPLHLASACGYAQDLSARCDIVVP
jgi:hypothetical protein